MKRNASSGSSLGNLLFDRGVSAGSIGLLTEERVRKAAHRVPDNGTLVVGTFDEALPTACGPGRSLATTRNWTAPDRLDQLGARRRPLAGGKYQRRVRSKPNNNGFPRILSDIIDEYDRTPYLLRIRRSKGSATNSRMGSAADSRASLTPIGSRMGSWHNLATVTPTGSWHNLAAFTPEEDLAKLEPDLGNIDVSEGTSAVAAAGWYIVLLISVVAMSLYGSFAQALHVNGTVLGCWVATGLFLCFVASFLLMLLHRPALCQEVIATFTFSAFMLLTLTGVASGVGSACMNSALKKTSQTDVYLFNSFPPIIIMMIRAVTGLPVFPMECAAVALDLFGAYLNIRGEVSRTPLPPDVPLLPSKPMPNISIGVRTGLQYDPGCPCPIYGAILALCSSATGAMTILTGKYLCDALPTPLLLAIITLFSSLAQVVILLTMPDSGTTLTNLLDEEWGLLGWATPRWFGLWAGAVGVIFLAQLCQQASLNGLPSLVVSMGQTAQPIVATGIAVSGIIAQAEPIPSLMSLIGGFLIVVGCMLLAYVSRNHQVDGTDDTADSAEGAKGPQHSSNWTAQYK